MTSPETEPISPGTSLLDADEAELLFADWGRSAAIAVDDPEALPPATHAAFGVLDVVVTSRELVRDEGGHRHRQHLTCLARVGELPEQPRIEWLLQIDAQWFDIVDLSPIERGLVRIRLAARTQPALDESPPPVT